MFALWLLETQTTLSYDAVRSVHDLVYPNWRAPAAHAPLKNQFQNTTHFVWHPASKKLVAYTKPNYLTVWALRPAVICMWQVHLNESGHPLKIAHNGGFGILALYKWYIYVYDGQTCRTIAGHYSDVAWAPDGSKFLVVGGRYMQLFTSTGQHICRWEHHKSCGMTQVCWRPDGFQFATSCEQGNIYLWTYDGRYIINQGVNAHFAPITYMTWNSAGTKFASVGEEFVNIWDASGALLSHIHVGPCRSVEWSPDGTKFVACGDAVHIYTTSGQIITSLEPHHVACAYWVCDAEIAAISVDGTLYKWTPKRR